MSAPEEVRAAATAAIEVGIPYTATCSFDTAGRTMMGLMPDHLGDVFGGLPVKPVAYGANCGVGAPDILASLLEMTAVDPEATAICKGNCGVPRFEGTEIVYSGTPELMGRYAALAVDAGARIIGGCCGTTPDHLAAMRAAIDAPRRGERPTSPRSSPRSARSPTSHPATGSGAAVRFGVARTGGRPQRWRCGSEARPRSWPPSGELVRELGLATGHVVLQLLVDRRVDRRRLVRRRGAASRSGSPAGRRRGRRPPSTARSSSCRPSSCGRRRARSWPACAVSRGSADLAGSRGWRRVPVHWGTGRRP